MRNSGTVILVTYNSMPEIENAITQIVGSGFRVVVVDNCSTDGTREFLGASHAAGLVDEIILSKENLGFAKAVNIGIAASPDGDVLLLNPDAEISAEDLMHLQDRLNGDRSIAVLAPVVWSGRGVEVMSAGRQPRLWPMFTHLSGLARLFPRSRWLRGRHLYLKSHSGAEQDVEWVSGCCMLISRESIDAVGTLSERWFMYGEDVDYCRRAVEQGFRVVVTPTARAFHQVGASVNRSDGRIRTLWATNLQDYYRHAYRPTKFTDLIWRLNFAGFMYARSAMHLAAGTLVRSPERRARGRQFAGHAGAVLRGSHD